MILIHAKAARVHKVGGAHENIFDNFMYIECCFVIGAIPPSDSLAILILGTLVCNRVPVSLSIFFAAKRERLRQLNLFDFQGRTWTINLHQASTTLFAHKEEATRTPPQVGKASWQMIDKHELKPTKHKSNY